MVGRATGATIADLSKRPALHSHRLPFRCGTDAARLAMCQVVLRTRRPALRGEQTDLAARRATPAVPAQSNLRATARRSLLPVAPGRVPADAPACASFRPSSPAPSVRSPRATVVVEPLLIRGARSTPLHPGAAAICGARRRDPHARAHGARPHPHCSWRRRREVLPRRPATRGMLLLSLTQIGAKGMTSAAGAPRCSTATARAAKTKPGAGARGSTASGDGRGTARAGSDADPRLATARSGAGRPSRG
jgi:hypothetical protein